METGLGLAGMVLVLSMSTGCGVDRDLSLSRFACAQGGSCDAGTAPVDTGPPLNLEFCPGGYSGFSMGTDPGTIEGTLFTDGTLALTFRTAMHGTGQLVRAKVLSDRSLQLVSGADQLSGFFDTDRCIGSGSWSLNGFGGNWEIFEE